MYQYCYRLPPSLLHVPQLPQVQPQCKYQCIVSSKFCGCMNIFMLKPWKDLEFQSQQWQNSYYLVYKTLTRKMIMNASYLNTVSYMQYGVGYIDWVVEWKWTNSCLALFRRKCVHGNSLYTWQHILYARTSTDCPQRLLLTTSCTC